ncbi:MAG: holo-ACP synthase [Gammaproteobacteria bacterium]|jgi:holo-[acyl-carrier protein] synthase
MIVGIGVDIAETARVRELAARFGERFAQRILTEDERAEFARRNCPGDYLATRFAAKEALAKALGTGIGGRFGFHSAQIDHDSAGRPVVRFLAPAEDLVRDLKITNAMISLSDERHYVVAMVVLESRPAAAGSG